jgi:hypothetical protein
MTAFISHFDNALIDEYVVVLGEALADVWRELGLR